METVTMGFAIGIVVLLSIIALVLIIANKDKLWKSSTAAT